MNNYEEAKKISLNRQQKAGERNHESVVLKCQVFLGKHIALGRGDGSYWQIDWDSASTMHPPWAGIGYDFKEYFLKNSSFCAVNTIFINDVPVRKDRDFAWNEMESLLLAIFIENINKALKDL